MNWKLSLTILTSLLLITNLTYGLDYHEKTVVIQSIYDKIYASTGSSELKPTLILDVKRKSKIAYIEKDNQGRSFIGFEDAAFDVCAALGNRRDDAIAYILGHELSHHVLKHSWTDDFTGRNGGSKLFY